MQEFTLKAALFEGLKAMVITIDGPAASGKSTVARSVAQKRGMYYLNTGFLYRAIAYVLVSEGAKDPLNLAQAATRARDWGHIISYTYAHESVLLRVRGQDVTQDLARFDAESSLVSASPVVRESVLAMSRQIAQSHDTVAEGRDCGSVVFPHADYKFFLTASLAIRAERLLASSRIAEQRSLEEVARELAARDTRDSQRVVAPLVIPADATVIDSSHLSVEQVVNTIMRLVGDAQ